ncbi:hypothetical protein AB5J62_37130 [Amycolatopsis sp. cg5]|uniref:hypothetical protein n=1 Tax=Amycolatopsis sp. cg5 TaxID=3238802 RepID=UPI0035254FCA
MSRWPALLAGLLLLTGCSTTITGSAFPLGGGPQADAPAYKPPTNGSGFSTDPLDQPLPLRSEVSKAACDWLPLVTEEMKPLGTVSSEAVLSGCQFVLPNNKGAQVHVYGPYNRITQTTSSVEPVQIAGLKGRVYTFDPPPVTFCSVLLDVRAYAALAVDGYDIGSEEAGNRAEHCEIAKKVAEVIAKKFVPLAGGTPWEGVVQEPPADALAKMPGGICEIVKFTHVNYAGISVPRGGGKEGVTPLGPSCAYESKYANAVGSYTTAGVGLAGVPEKPGARVTPGKFGVLPSRIEQTATSCTLSVELQSKQVLQTEFTPVAKDAKDKACESVKVTMAVSVASLISGIS